LALRFIKQHCQLSKQWRTSTISYTICPYLHQLSSLLLRAFTTIKKSPTKMILKKLIFLQNSTALSPKRFRNNWIYRKKKSKNSFINRIHKVCPFCRMAKLFKNIYSLMPKKSWCNMHERNINFWLLTLNLLYSYGFYIYTLQIFYLFRPVDIFKLRHHLKRSVLLTFFCFFFSFFASSLSYLDVQ
jgi:hypothetical protein